MKNTLRSDSIFVIALHTGLRRGDILGLEWSAVDLKAGNIRLMTEKSAQPVIIPLSKEAHRRRSVHHRGHSE